MSSVRKKSSSTEKSSAGGASSSSQYAEDCGAELKRSKRTNSLRRSFKTTYDYTQYLYHSDRCKKRKSSSTDKSSTDEISLLPFSKGLLKNQGKSLKQRKVSSDLSTNLKHELHSANDHSLTAHDSMEESTKACMGCGLEPECPFLFCLTCRRRICITCTQHEREPQQHKRNHAYIVVSADNLNGKMLAEEVDLVDSKVMVMPKFPHVEPSYLPKPMIENRTENPVNPLDCNQRLYGQCCGYMAPCGDFSENFDEEEMKKYADLDFLAPQTKLSKLVLKSILENLRFCLNRRTEMHTVIKKFSLLNTKAAAEATAKLKPKVREYQEMLLQVMRFCKDRQQFQQLVKLCVKQEQLETRIKKLLYLRKIGVKNLDEVKAFTTKMKEIGNYRGQTRLEAVQRYYDPDRVLARKRAEEERKRAKSASQLDRDQTRGILKPTMSARARRQRRRREDDDDDWREHVGDYLSSEETPRPVKRAKPSGTAKKRERKPAPPRINISHAALQALVPEQHQQLDEKDRAFCVSNRFAPDQLLNMKMSIMGYYLQKRMRISTTELRQFMRCCNNKTTLVYKYLLSRDLINYPL